MVKLHCSLLLLLLISVPLHATPHQLTQQQIHKINMGMTCCYSEETIASVKPYGVDPDTFRYPTYDMKIVYTPQEQNIQWILFWATQLADVWTTNRAMDFTCIREANPILPERPKVSELLLLKGLVLAPLYLSKKGRLDHDGRNSLTYVTAIIVAQNFDIIDQAKSDGC